MMSMARQTFVLLVSLLLVLPLYVAGCGGGPEDQPEAAPPDVFFEGVLVIRNGDDTLRYEAHITRQAQRLVPFGMDNPGAVIIRRDLGVTWNLMPEKKVFLETPIRPEHKNPLIYVPDEIIKSESLGEEYVQGIKADKERVVFKNTDDVEKTVVRWIARGIEWPLKAEDPEGKWEMHFEEVVFKEQTPAYFEIPEGYSMITARRSHWPAGP